MALQDVVKQIAETLEKEGNSRVVFGEPLKLDTRVLIPVAAVRMGMGAGGTRASTDNGANAGGGAGAFTVLPVGFIHERGQEIVFTPIHLDVRGRPFLTEAAQGVGRAVDTMAQAFTTYVRARLEQGKAQVEKPVRPLEGQVTA